jgi:predicted glycoside hydrolase/deacetylase ChbG (UPF0249 family)
MAIVLPPGGGPRRLIVNADDFGQSAGINDGITQAYERGIVTSASLMVHWPWASAAAEYARTQPALSVGLHLDLGEWVYWNGEWVALYQRVALHDVPGLRAEVMRQIDLFQQLMASRPTHIDSHQHVHGRALIRPVVAEIANQLGVPVRQTGGQIAYLGEFYGQEPHGAVIDSAITVEHLIGLLGALPDGITELGCHPGLRADAHGMYIVEREQEVQVLCDPDVRAALVAGRIELISFHDVARLV